MSSSLPDRPALPAAELLLAAIVDSSDDAIISKNLDGIITSWNRSAERIFGYTSDEAVGRPVTMLLPLDRPDEEKQILQRVRQGEKVDHFETIRRRKDGGLVEVSVTISPIRDRAGVIVGASKVARDIAEQNRGNRAGLHLAAIVNSSEDAIVSKNLQGIIQSWNRGAELTFGYTEAEAVGQSVLMLIPPDRKDEESKIIARLQKGERVDHFETIRLRKDGTLFPVSLTISPVRDRHGAIVGASKIARDITVLKQISAEREEILESERAARAQAETANRMKDEFLTTVSHELRTPLNAIVAWTQVLKESDGATKDILDGLEIVERNAHMQAQLIDDLLDLGRIVAGKLPLDIQRTDVTAVINDAVASVQAAAENKNIRIKSALSTSPAAILGDKKRIQQVVWNLLANAIKFTPKNGSVTITLSRINSHLDIAVSDNGQGIAPEFLPHVFERFRQADASTTRQHGGLGIGLSLVKQLVEMHGGTVHAASPGKGKGSTFTVSLPVTASRPPDGAVEDFGRNARGPDLPPAEDLTGIKVLAVDDDADSLAGIKRILASRHATVETAASAEEALQIFASFKPDVLLSDIGMPQRDGYDLIRAIRKLPDGQTLPAAALTALARPEDRMRALQAGFQTHISKPVATAEIIAVVRSLASLRPAPHSDRME
jgi:PAS domain S-box-containing protein